MVRVQARGRGVALSAVDDGHLRFFVALARGRGEVVQAFDLLGAELKAVGGAPSATASRDPTPKGKGKHGVMDSRLCPIPTRRRSSASSSSARRAAQPGSSSPAGSMRSRRRTASCGPRSTVKDMIGRRTYLGEVRSGKYRKADAHEPIVTPALWRKAQNGAGRRTPRGTYLLSGIARCASCGRTLRGSALGRKPHKGRKAAPPRIYTCANRACEARPTIVVDRLDDEVTEQFFAHLDAFHIEAVEDAELDSARAEVEDAPPRSRRSRRWCRATRRRSRHIRQRWRPPSARSPRRKIASTPSRWPRRPTGRTTRELRDDLAVAVARRAARTSTRGDRGRRGPSRPESRVPRSRPPSASRSAGAEPATTIHGRPVRRRMIAAKISATR